MNIRAHLTPNHWPLIAALASLAALGTAHAFENFGGLHPCALCLRQREVYWLALAIAAIAFIAMRTKPNWPIGRYATPVLGLVFLFGAVLAGYHAGVEWKFWLGPATCTGGGEGLAGLTTADLSAALSTASKAPQCDEIAWSLFGISMAGWNAVLSFALAGLSFFSTFAPAKAGAKQ